MRAVLRELGAIIADLVSQQEIWVLLLLIVFAMGISGIIFVLPSFDGTLSVREILHLSWYFIRFMLAFFFFILLWGLIKGLWMFWRQSIYKSKWEYATLEIVVPREIKKGAQAMEQILKSIHMIRKAPRSMIEKYWEGGVVNYFSIEIVSDGGQVHLYIRVPQKTKKFIEAAFYSFYSDLEIKEINDYVTKIPQTIQGLYEQNKDMWGSEVILAKDDMYPIKSYKDFQSGEDDEKQFDPISVLFEVLGKIKPGEFVGVQLILTPKDDKWADVWKDKVKELREKAKLDESGIESVAQTQSIKSIENNLAKPAFDTTVRFLYISEKEIFNDGFVSSGLMGSFNQYSAGNLNAFKKGWDTSTKTASWPHVFAQRRNEYKKQRILYNYLFRIIAEKSAGAKLMTSHLYNWNVLSKEIILNTESVATIYHPPTNIVLINPHMKRSESKSVGPTSGLEIFGEEEEIQEFLKH